MGDADEKKEDNERSSPFVGVYKKKFKYWGKMNHKKKTYYCGPFSNELDAAKAVNAKCVELGIPLKNPEIELPEYDSQKEEVVDEKKVEPKLISEFTCVFLKNTKSVGLKYHGRIRHKKKEYYCGSFSSDLDAAKAVNAKCIEIGIRLKNPEIGPPEYKSQKKEDIDEKEEESKTKKIKCVFFDKRSCTFLAKIHHKKKQYYCGCFSNKLDAAKAVNAKCVQIGIPLKNPEIGLPEYKSQKKEGIDEKEKESEPKKIK